MKQLLVLSIFLFCGVNIFLPSFLNGYSTSLEIDFLELINNSGFQDILHRRSTDPIFSTRFVIYSFLRFCNNEFGVPEQLVYNLIIGLSIVSILLSVYRLAKEFNSKDDIYLIFIYFFLSFPVLFCLCSMMAGFDDMLHWAISLRLLVYLKKNKLIPALACFLLGFLVREAILLIIPLFLALSPLKKRFKLLLSFIALFIIGFIIIRGWVSVKNNAEILYVIGRPNQLTYNFITFLPRTLWVLYAAVLFPLTLLNNTKLNPAYIHVILTTNVILLITIYVDEARASFYPFLFLLPFFAKGIRDWLQYLRSFIKLKLWIFIILIFASAVFAFYIYNPCVSKSCLIYKMYAFVFIPLTLPYIAFQFQNTMKFLYNKFTFDCINTTYFGNPNTL